MYGRPRSGLPCQAPHSEITSREVHGRCRHIIGSQDTRSVEEELVALGAPLPPYSTAGTVSTVLFELQTRSGRIALRLLGQCPRCKHTT